MDITKSAILIALLALQGTSHKLVKRQAPPSFVNECFTACLDTNSPNRDNWRSIVDFMILHTSWFGNSDVGSCAPNNPDVIDEANCWKAAYGNLIDLTSPNLPALLACVDKFVLATRGNRARRWSVDSHTTGQPLDNPNCPSVDKELFASLLLNHVSDTDLTSTDSTLQGFRFVIDFVMNEALCVEPTCDRCNVNYANAFDPSEELECNECWPTRLAGMIKDSSPLKNASTLVAIEVQNSDPPRPTQIHCGSGQIGISVGRFDTRDMMLMRDERLIIWDTSVSNLSDVDAECQSANTTEFSFPSTSCQPILKSTGDQITMTYTIRKVSCTPDGVTLRRYYDASMNVTCSYHRTDQVNTGDINPLIRKIILPGRNESGQFTIDLGFYDDSFEELLAHGATVFVPNNIYLAGHILIQGNVFVLQAINCWASSSGDNPLPILQLIENGCPARNALQQTSPIVVENGVSTQVRFVFRSFAWIGMTDSPIFVSCRMRVCNTEEEDCAFDCSNRRRSNRDVAVSSDRTSVVSIGPVRIMMKGPCAQNNGGCSDVCEIKGGNVFCSCFTGRTLLGDESTCLGDQYLLQSQPYEPTFFKTIIILCLCLLIIVLFLIIRVVRKREKE